MKSIARRTIACLLAVVMLIGIIPAAAAMAAQTEEMISIVGANMTLGNELVLNFMINASDIDDPDAYTAVVTQAGKTTQLPLREYNAKFYCVSYGVAAKEMTDEVSVYLADGNGDAVSEVYSRSIQDYAVSALNGYAADNALLQTMLVDMLCYGTEAQKYFGYNEDAYANGVLTEEQLAMGGTAAACGNDQVAGENFYGANLSLEDRILLNLFFTAGADVSGMYAEVEYENYRGENKLATVAAATYSADLCKVTVDQIVLADARQDVSVKLYTAEGELCGEAVDSVESYVARTNGTAMAALNEAIMRFADSACAYLMDGEEAGKVPAEDQASAEVQVGEDGAVTEDVSMEGETVSATVPAGVTVKEGTTSLILSVSGMEESDADVTVGENETALSLNVHVDGVADSNTKAILVNLGEVLPKALNKGNMALYHVENGETVAMTRVSGLSELDEHNEFYYDPITGEVTVALASFSEIMMVNEQAKWEGDYDFSWYDPANTTHTIANADQLAGLSAIVGGMIGQTPDSFAGETIELIADIDLGDAEAENDPNVIFYPIGYYNTEGTYEKSGTAITSDFRLFEGTFDGKGHTIANFYQNTWEMKGDHHWYAATEQNFCDGMGLFGIVYGGTVKNLTIDHFSSDGEIANTGSVAAYADCGATFENIAITNCNPRVYNIGNGGIVGNVGWFLKEETDKVVTFKNITVDNTNKISALWGSWDVSCGGLVGFYDVVSKYNITNPGIHLENCHVAAQIDVNNDVCGNYQYYQYRYAGMVIGTISENVTGEDGRIYPKMDGITAKGCTVKYGDWNDYYYCELVANSLASYTHDHQMSRLVKIESLDEIKAGETWLKAGNFLLIDGDTKTCYHIVKDAEGNLCEHRHEDSGEETVNGETVLKEDKQIIYLPFDQMFTGYGWGVTYRGIKDFEGITNLDISYGEDDTSVTKFEYVGQESYFTEQQVTLGDLFKLIDDCEVEVDGDNVQVFVTAADENSDASATYTANTEDWTQGTVTFSGTGAATITITDYYYCTATVAQITVEICDHAITYVVNEDGTHTKVYTCSECGKNIFKLEEPTKIVVDLEAAVAAAAEAGMFDAMTKTDDGLAINVYTNRAALASFNAWTQENYGWQIASTASALTYNSTYVKTFIDVTDSYDWTVAHIVPYFNAERNFFDVSVTVPEAGYYKLGLNAYTEPALTMNDDPTTGTKQGGTNAFNFKVNGETVVPLFHSGASPKGSFTDKSLGVVYLNEGANTITMGTNSLTRHGYLNGYVLTKVETEVEVGTTAEIDLSAYNAFSDTAEYTYTAQASGDVDVTVDGSVLSVEALDYGEATVTVTAVSSDTEKTYVMNVLGKAMEETYDCDLDADGFCTVCGYDSNCYHTKLDVDTIDFKKMAIAASKEDFWNDLPAFTTKNGYEVKAIGLAYGNSMDTTQMAAARAFFAWVEANYNWSINNDKSLFTSTVGNRLYLCADENVAWGINQWNYYVNHDNAYRDSLFMDLVVDETGYYKLDMQAYLTGVNSDYVDTTAMAAGGGKVDIFVNDTLVYDNYSFGGADKIENVTIANVLLQEGVNTIRFRTVDDINNAHANDGKGYLTRTNTSLISLTATAAQSVSKDDGTHTIELVCPDCGESYMEPIVEDCRGMEDGICDLCGYDINCYHTDMDFRVNFKEAVTAFAEQHPEHWANIPDAVEGNSETKIFGNADKTVITDAEKAAFAAFNTFMAENYGVSVATDINAVNHRRLYLTTAEKAKWGMAYYPSSLAWSNGSEADNRIDLTVKAETDGYYKLDFGTIQHTAGNASVAGFQNFTGHYPGCGTIDVYVDGKLVINDYKLNVADFNAVTLDLGTVYLTEGDHTVSVHVITDNNDLAYGAGGRRTVILTDLNVVKVTVVDNGNKTHTVSGICQCGEVLVGTFTANCADKDEDGACDVCGSSAE